MLNLKQAVVVEGKYDKIKLSSIIASPIICTDGFRIFTDKEKMKIIRHYAENTGIIILTDSDSAGFKIRNYIKGAVGAGNIINVYIPDILGKERRKTVPSKEGKLGVEGMSEKVLIDAFEKAGVNACSSERICDIDKQLLYELGFSGRPDAAVRRRALLRHLGLPELMTAKAMAEILGTMMSAEELTDITDKILSENTEEND